MSLALLFVDKSVGLVIRRLCWFFDAMNLNAKVLPSFGPTREDPVAALVAYIRFTQLHIISTHT